MSAIRNLMKIMPSDSLMLVGMATGVYAYGAIVSSQKIRQERTLTQTVTGSLERKYNSTPSA
jgi:hypothetical protein